MSGTVTSISAAPLLDSLIKFNTEFQELLSTNTATCGAATNAILKQIREYLLALLKEARDLNMDPALKAPLQVLNTNLELACQSFESLKSGCPEFFIFHDSKPFMQILLSIISPSDGEDPTEALENLKIFLETHQYHQETSADNTPGTVDLSRLGELFSRIYHEDVCKKLTLSFDAALGTDYTAIPTGNRSLLWTAIYNLVSNAAKYGQKNSDGQYEIRISVSATLDGKSVITVSNPGMLPEPTVSHFSSAFRKISTLTTFASADGASSGRALQELINRGAQFKISQTDGRVSFSFKVPAHTHAPSPIPASSTFTPPRALLSSASAETKDTPEDKRPTLHILVVDDADKKILMARTLPGLQASGYHVVISVADTYEDPSVDTWREGPGSKILIADHNIDGGAQSGLGFVQDLRKAGDTTPVIFIAGNSMDEYLKGQKLPSDCYDNQSKMLTLSGPSNPVLEFLFETLGIEFTWVPARRPTSTPSTPARSATLLSNTGDRSHSSVSASPRSPDLGNRNSPPALPGQSKGYSLSLVAYSPSAGAGSGAGSDLLP